MLSKLDPGLIKILTAVVCVGLGVVAFYYPSVQELALAAITGLLGSAYVRRPGDVPLVGVHPDDLKDSRS